MVSLWTACCAFLIFIGMYVFLGLRYRKLNGGYLTFKDAFALIFFMILHIVEVEVFHTRLFEHHAEQGQLQLRCCSGKHFQQEVVVPTATAAFHYDAVAAGMLLQER